MLVSRYCFLMVFVLNTVFLLMGNNSITYELLLTLDKNRISITDKKDFPNCFITYVTIDGVPYIVKQKRIPTKKFSAIRDAIAAWVALDLNIAHVVHIIPADKSFPGKEQGWPALLLTIAPGKTIKSQPESRYYALALKQRKDPDIMASDKWLTEIILEQITWHDQLPIIVGLDLFVCNTGRHNANLFYDPAQDIFCAIDMDHCYRLNLPSIAIARLNRMILKKKIFTQAEVRALKIMKKTLEFLAKKHSAQQIVEQLYLFTKQARITNNIYISSIGKKLEKDKKVIMESRSSVINLISLLDNIIGVFSNKT